MRAQIQRDDQRREQILRVLRRQHVPPPGREQLALTNGLPRFVVFIRCEDMVDVWPDIVLGQILMLLVSGARQDLG